MNIKELMIPVRNVCHRAYMVTLKYASDLGERVAAQPLGQFLIQKTEDIVWAFEKSIEWSLPLEVKRSTEQTGKELEQNGYMEKGATPRPLPWILFIPVLIAWRCAKITYETAWTIMGSTPAKPVEVVNFLRNQRRNLRAVRIRGKRTMTSHDTSPTAFSKLRSIAQHVFSRAMCFTGTDSHKEETRTRVEVTAHSELVEKKEEEEDTENVMQKLNRLSREEDTVEDDPDYEPGETSLSSVGSASSGGDVTEEEREDAGVARSSFIGGAIVEEDESSEVEDGESSEVEASQPPPQPAQL